MKDYIISKSGKWKKKYIRSTYIIKLKCLDSSIKLFINGVSCANFLKVSNYTITKRLNDGKPVKNKAGLIVALQRIRVYSSPKPST